MTLRLRTLPRFPARIIGTAGLKTVRDGTDVLVSNDYGALNRIPNVNDPSTSLFAIWDSEQDSYSTISFDDMFSAVDGAFRVMGDESIVVINDEKTIQTSVPFTVARTVTLPLAASVQPGREIIIDDSRGAVSSTAPLIVARQGSDVINPGNQVSITLSTAGTALRFVSDGVSRWAVQWVNSEFVAFNNKLSGGTSTSLNDKLSDKGKTTSLLDFAGADPTGVGDSTAALNAWYATITPGKVGTMPPGTFRFTSALTWAGRDRISVVGAARGLTKLVYNGANTTNDIITYGDYADTYIDCVFKDFTVTSDTLMTGGYAFRLKGLSNSIVNRVSMDGQHGSGKLWHGIYFDGIQACRYEDYETYCQRDGVSVSGTVGFGPKSLMHLKEGWQLGTSLASSVGIRIGGAFGGVYVDAVDCSGAMFAACVVDQTLKAEANREVFLWNADFDAGHTYSLLVQHSDGSPGVYRYDGCFFFSPVRLQSGDSANHKFTACSFSPNLGGDGLRVDSTMLVFIYSCDFLPQTGYGINITNASHNVVAALGNNFSTGAGLGAWNTTNRPKQEIGSFASLESAATTDISSYPIENITVTGTTTITSFGAAAAGTRKLIRFAGILTLTHNAASMILKGGSNITTFAGMVLEFVSLGSSNWQQINAADSNYYEAVVASVSSISITTGSPANVASVLLPPGEYDLTAVANFTPGATTNTTIAVASFGSVSANLDATPGQYGELALPAAGVVIGARSPSVALSGRVVVTTATTYYLVVQANFTVSTMKAWGKISARRVR